MRLPFLCKYPSAMVLDQPLKYFIKGLFFNIYDVGAYAL